MATWTRQRQPTTGSHLFDGRFYVSPLVEETLTSDEILAIQQDARTSAAQAGGIFRRQVYQDETGRELHLIDQLSAEEKASPSHEPNLNFCTLYWYRN